MSMGDESHEVYAYLAGVPFYRIEIPRQLWDRLVSFSKRGSDSVPDWIDLGPGNMVDENGASRRVIATEKPEWFNTTYREMMGPNAEH